MLAFADLGSPYMLIGTRYGLHVRARFALRGYAVKPSYNTIIIATICAVKAPSHQAFLQPIRNLTLYTPQ